MRLRLLLRRRGRRERAEQAVLLPPGARGEEQGIRRPVGGVALAEAQGPEAVDLDRTAAGGMQRAPGLELAQAVEFHGVESVDTAVAEVSDEQVVAEGAEVGGGTRQPPGGVELAPGSDAAEQVASGVE